MTPTTQRDLSEYLEKKVLIDPIGRKITLFRLNDKGKIVAEYILRKYGRDSGPSSGISLERRHWLFPVEHNFKKVDIVSAFKKICGEDYVEVKRDWENGRKRIHVKDIESRIWDFAVKIKWETERDDSMLNDCERFVWKYLDSVRKELRKNDFQVEFVLWGT